MKFNSNLTMEIRTERDLLLEMYSKPGEGFRLVELFNVTQKSTFFEGGNVLSAMPVFVEIT